MRLAVSGLTIAVGLLAITVAILAAQIAHMEGRLSAQMNGLETRVVADVVEMRDTVDSTLVEVAIVQAQMERVYETTRATGTMLMIHMKKAGTWPGEPR